MISGLSGVSLSSPSKLRANLIGKCIQMQIFDNALLSLLSFNVDTICKDI